MKKSLLLKTLLNGLCFLCLLWLTPVLMVLKGKTTINNIDIDIYHWNLFEWFVSILAVISSIFFLRGLFLLRKSVNILVTDYLSESNIENSNKTGFSFFVSGAVYFFVILILWLHEVISSKEIIIGYDMDLLVPLVIVIIGVFFMIQADKISEAKVIKEENELTI